MPTLDRRVRRLERPSQEFLEGLSKEYGKVKIRTVDLDLRPATLPMTPMQPKGYVILVAVQEEKGIALVRHAETSGGIFSFPMRALQGGVSIEDLGRRIGQEDLGLSVRVYKVPALHIGRFQYKDQEVERWHFIAVGKVEGDAEPGGLPPGTEVILERFPMSLPHWRESDWYYWIARDAELHV